MMHLKMWMTGIFFLTIAGVAYPQDIVSKVTNAAGKSVTTGSITLEWSVGEMVAVTTLTAGDNTLTQGLLQPVSSLQGPLPVNWLFFKAKLINDQTQLDWGTAQEINSSRFDIERSANGSDFQFLQSATAAGNSITPRHYQAFDPAPFIGFTYYRLKQVDIDGHFIYSPVVQVQKNQSANFSVYPNPATETVYIKIPATRQSRLLQVSDMAGKLLTNEIIPAGVNFQQVNIGNLPAGVYFIQIRQGQECWQEKLVKL